MADVYKAVYDYLVENPYTLDDGDEWYYEYWEQISIEENYNGKDTVIKYESENLEIKQLRKIGGKIKKI